MDEIRPTYGDLWTFHKNSLENPCRLKISTMPLLNINQHIIEWKQGKWYMNCGGVHGIPTNKTNQIYIGIYKTSTDKENPILEVSAQEVLLGETILNTILQNF